MAAFDEVLKKDTSKILAMLINVPGEKKVLAKEKLYAYFPVSFEEAGLATISNVVTTIGYIMLATEDRLYGCYSVPARISMEGTDVNKVKSSDGTTYYEIEFEPGSAVIANTDLLMDELIGYRLFNLFLHAGKIPFYYSNDDIIRLLDELPYFSGSGITRNYPIMDMLTSIMMRDPDDISKHYRHYITREKRKEGRKAGIAPLSNPSLGRANTTSKLLGNYYGETTTSALVNPSTKPGDLETLLRL